MQDILADQKTISLYMEDTGGDGPVVILVHDWPLTMDSLRAQIGPLKDAGFRVISYDRRGFGRSEAPTHGYDYDYRARDLAALILQKGVREVTVVGFGMGAGEMIHAVTILGADYFKQIIFAATVTPYMLVSDENPNGWLPLATYNDMVQQLKADRNGFFLDLMKKYHSVKGELRITEAQLQDLVKMCGTSDENAALKCMDSLCRTDHRPSLPHKPVLTTYLHGNEDAFAPLQNSMVPTKDLVGGLQVGISDAPHGFNITDSEKFNRTLIDIIKKGGAR